MDFVFSTFGAIVGLVIAIFLIIKKFHPAYSLILGALIGGIVGGGTLDLTVSTMVVGAQGMMSSVLRIMASGILAGTLIKTGSAEKIAEVIVSTFGEKRALIALSVATGIICAVGVFIDIAVITVAPIALAIGLRANYSKSAILIAMIGGGKAGNIISPNPNTIAISEAFGLELTDVILKNAIPALFALIMTIIVSSMINKKYTDKISTHDLEERSHKDLPSFMAAISGPIAVVILLSLRPLAGISVDPLIALPAGGIVSAIFTNKIKEIKSFAEFGLSKVIGVSILLIGTGTISGIIKASALQTDVIALLEMLSLPAFILAPIAGILMGAATASTTAGSTIAAQTFSSTLLAAGIPALSAGAMIHAGATVLDSLPHGSFFHATGGAVGMSIKDRIKLIIFEATIGMTSTIVITTIYLIS